MAQTGSIIVLTGEGKGKTTSSIGLALKAVGQDKRVFMVQFMKAADTSGEHFSAPALHPWLVIKPMGRKGFIRRRGGEPEDREMARKALNEARFQMLDARYDLIILDEVNIAIDFGLIEPSELLDLIDSKPDTCQLVITGRNAHPQIVERADCVLEMKMIKHHFDAGVPAEEGIEY